MCTALTWHGDRHCVPLSPLQTEKKKKKITQRFAGFVCQWRSPRLFWYTLRWEVRRRVMSDACACSRHLLVSGAVGLPARHQVAPAQHACVLPCLFFYEPPSRFSSSESLRYCCCRRRHVMAASRGDARLCTVCICKREHSTQRSCVL